MLTGVRDELIGADVNAGRDDEAYAACAAELWALCGALVRRL